MTSALVIAMILWAEPGWPHPPPAPHPAPATQSAFDDGGTIIVSGKRQEEEQVILGSRISRPDAPDPRGFVSQIASTTGIAGLTPGSGMNPLAGPTRNITVKSCKGSDPRMTMAALCDLALAQKHILKGELVSARSAIARILSNPKSQPADQFFAHRFAYQVASIQNNPHDRKDALEGMVESGLLSAQDRMLARKTLASMALSRGDDAAAVTQLEQLLVESPHEATAQANLGVLYAKLGFHDRARPRIAEAVRLTAPSGQPAPKSWTDYLAGRN